MTPSIFIWSWLTTGASNNLEIFHKTALERKIIWIALRQLKCLRTRTFHLQREAQIRISVIWLNPHWIYSNFESTLILIAQNATISVCVRLFFYEPLEHRTRVRAVFINRQIMMQTSRSGLKKINCSLEDHFRLSRFFSSGLQTSFKPLKGSTVRTYDDVKRSSFFFKIFGSWRSFCFVLRHVSAT